MKYFLKMETVKPLKKKGSTKQKGTKICFLPSKEVFSSIKFSSSILEKRIKRTCFFK